MLCTPVPLRLSEFDLQVCRIVVPEGLFLRKVLQVVPWENFHALLPPVTLRTWDALLNRSS
jgi:hypothetical protein